MVPEQFRDVARQYRNELAIIDGEERITYGRLLHRLAEVRDWLRARLDPGPGDVIAASLSNTWQFVACFLAVSELGAVFMPCHRQWRARELRWFAGRLQFRGVLSERQFRNEWDQVGEVIPPGRIVTVEEDLSSFGTNVAPDAPPATLRSEEDAAVYLATSGSTGAPRIVPRSHRNLLAGARNAARALGLGPGHRFLSVVPFHHSNGFHNCLCLPLLSGAALVVMRQFTPAACAELVRRERVDVFIGSPFLYSHLADRVTNAGLLSSLGLCVSAGARMPAGVAARWRDRFGVRVRQLYGSSETSVISIDCSPDEPPRGGLGDFVGAPIPEVEVRCLGSGGEDLGPGQTGEIAVRSPAVMSGYVGEPESNSRVFQHGFFRTGDLGRLDAESRLYLQGRIGRVINFAGVKVDPVEIEQAVEALPGVSACHVDAVPAGREGEVIRARIVVRDGAPMTRREVVEHCRQRLAEYKMPRVIEFVESLPATISGKMPKDWNADELRRPPGTAESAR